MIEVWKCIPGFEGLYFASSLGNIRSKNKIRKKIINKNGYFYVLLSKNGKVKNLRVHRLIAKTFVENKENKKQVNHKNGIKTDNRVINLEWCSCIENHKHAIKNGLIDNKGEKHGQSKLTKEIVIQIRKKYIPWKYTQKKLAREFGVSQATISYVLKNETWKHIRKNK